jgi:hypothetical protein
MVRTDSWKLGQYGDGDGELYDMTNDPTELRNLYHLPEYREIRAELITRLANEAISGYGLRSQLNRCPPDEERARAFEEIAATS